MLNLGGGLPIRHREDVPDEATVAGGDHVDVMSAGAYTASYASIGFNGFPPLKEYYL